MSTLSSRIRDLAPALKLRAESFQNQAREARHMVSEAEMKLRKGTWTGEAARLQAIVKGQTERAKALDEKAQFAAAEAKAAGQGLLLTNYGRTDLGARDPRVNQLLSEAFEAGVVKRYDASEWVEGYTPPADAPRNVAEFRQSRGLHPDWKTDPVAPDPQEQLRQGAILAEAERAEATEAERVNQAEATARAVEAVQSAPQSARSAGVGLLLGGW